MLKFSAGIMEDNNRRSARNYQSLLGRLEDNGAEREILQVRLAHEIKEIRTMVRVGGRGIGFKEAEKKREKSKSRRRGKKFSYESYEPRKEKGKKAWEALSCRSSKKTGGDSLGAESSSLGPRFLATCFPPSLF